MKKTQLFLVVVTLMVAITSLLSAKQSPVIPYSSLVRYTASYDLETLESMRMLRLYLHGRISMKMDILEGHVRVPAQGRASARFQIEAVPQFQVDLLSFPSGSFPFELNDETLNSYLDDLASKEAPSRKFEVVAKSAYSPEGESKFRILGRRAHQIIYSFTQKGVGRLTVAENWVQADDYIHIVKVQAPSDRFELQLREVGPVFSSAVEL